jgi:hypothetical protein
MPGSRTWPGCPPWSTNSNSSKANSGQTPTPGSAIGTTSRDTGSVRRSTHGIMVRLWTTRGGVAVRGPSHARWRVSSVGSARNWVKISVPSPNAFATPSMGAPTGSPYSGTLSTASGSAWQKAGSCLGRVLRPEPAVPLAGRSPIRAALLRFTSRAVVRALSLGRTLIQPRDVQLPATV